MTSLLRPFFLVGSWIKKHWKLSLFVLLLLAGGGYFWYQRTRAAEPELQFITVTQADMVKTVNVSGVIDAQHKVSLRYAAGGKVVFIGAQEGDIVRRGQTLARLDTRDLQKRLNQDLNLYFNQRLSFEGNLDDRQDRAPTETLNRVAQQDQKTLENSVLNVELRDIAIREANLVTPISGFLVSSPTVVPGVVLGPTDVFEVVDPTSLVFKAAVSETDISLVRLGQPATIELDAYPDQELNATVSAIAYRSSQTAKGTVFVVELPVPIESTSSAIQRYRLGMNGDTNITVDQRQNALQVPLDSISERDGKKYVQKRTGPNQATEVEVQTGLETDDTVEILAGLQAGDEVVLP